MKHLSFFVLALLAYTSCALPRQQRISTLRPGRLIFALDASENRNETRKGNKLGGATRHLLNALQQEAGIIIAHTPLWENALWWQERLYLPQRPFHTHHAPHANLTVLIPQNYLKERLAVVPRRLQYGQTHADCATGLWLSKVESIQTLTDLFIANKHAHPYAQTRWMVYMNGHGMNAPPADHWEQLLEEKGLTEKKSCIDKRAQKHLIAGLSLVDFVDLLHFFDEKLSVKIFYYQSCYGGGDHTRLAHYYNTLGRTQAQKDLSLHFPLIAGSLSDTIVTTYPTRTRISLFFDRIEEQHAPLDYALEAITPLISHSYDLHAVTCTPLLLAPRSERFQPITLSYKNAQLPAKVSYLTHVKEITHASDSQPYTVKKSRAFLIAPQLITTPLIIHTYKPSKLPPALVSMVPGNAIHHIQNMTLHGTGLYNFLLYGFLHAAAQKSEKVFLIDALTLDNDIRTSFTDTTNTWWNFFFENNPVKTSRITLRKVVLVSSLDTIRISFQEPLEKGTFASRSITISLSLHPHFCLYKKVNGSELYTKERESLFAKKQTFPLTTLSAGAHTALYEKYKTTLLSELKDRDGITSDRRCHYALPA